MLLWPRVIFRNPNYSCLFGLATAIDVCHEGVVEVEEDDSTKS